MAYLALAEPLPRVFTGDEGVLADVASVWLLVALLQPLGGAVFVLDGVLMGAGDFRFLFASTALAALGGLVPVAVLAVLLGWGLTGIWYGMLVLMTIRLVTTLVRLRGTAWSEPAPA